mmetsp:Transcript_14946/g.36399  ORF Transcript_14946/g.36399 Transcript_14946/m.36399 type:complete len:135 (+) Transcript_14946:1233-1637(+)
MDRKSFQKIANNNCDAGAWNCLIFFRPKYLETRRKFRDQTRIWAARRCIFGQKVRPVQQTENIRFSQESLAQSSRIGNAGELSSRAESMFVPQEESAQEYRAQTGVSMTGEVSLRISSSLAESAPKSQETRVSG